MSETKNAQLHGLLNKHNKTQHDIETSVTNLNTNPTSELT